ncbi:YxiJ family protein [Saccharibacillus sp. CPCC 101409]|uniref:YxiJ family protein n=1 Tax=Saccharibacillus sp. CPCC 101409 TaxID=3058041 RepID=UPI0026734791|nr:YxiJ family protein [Saccharibacillus sp. CPCC 101409]MDO3410924.1 YxiJ family protein [Saccharibacillus sp. CPCC 101409]
MTRIDLLNEQIEELRQLYRQQAENRSFPHDEIRQLEDDFADEFSIKAPQEIIKADIITYMSFTEGLASGGIASRLEDPLERYKMRKWLNKSFFEWFPKYRFLERYDLSGYETLNKELTRINEWRRKLIALIDLREQRPYKI